MDMPMVCAISPDPDTWQLVALDLSRRGFWTMIASPQQELDASGAEKDLKMRLLSYTGDGLHDKLGDRIA